MAMNSDELIEKLGDDFYELKKLVIETPVGNFFAYSPKEHASGFTPKEALENLTKLVNDRKIKGEVA